ncbi:MAG: hypothetical protein ACRDHP_13520 [Ktedonobacterales bacterium]
MIPHPNPQTAEMKREIQAAMAARNELGPDYDDHFAQVLADKLAEQVRQQVAKAPQPHTMLSSGQRTAVAIVSVVFLFVLPVSFHDVTQIPVMLIFALAALGINFAASR